MKSEKTMKTVQKFWLIFLLGGLVSCAQLGMDGMMGGSGDQKQSSSDSSSPKMKQGQYSSDNTQAKNDPAAEKGQPVSEAGVRELRKTITAAGNDVLTFTSDFNKPDQDQISFKSTEPVYARVKLPKTPIELLPEEFEYYRVRLAIKVDDNLHWDYESSQKFSGQDGRLRFTTAYNSQDLLLPVLPAQTYYQFVEKRHEKEAFGKADASARFFNMGAPHILQRVDPGKRRVKIIIEFSAKVRDGAKTHRTEGNFIMDFDSGSSAHFETMTDHLKKWSETYEQQFSKLQGILEDEMRMQAEEKKMAAMSPEERECYKTAKTHKLMYLACYKGPTKNIRFVQVDSDEHTGIVISWPDHQGKSTDVRYRAGASTVAVWKDSPETIPVPIGAKVTKGASVLIPKVTAATPGVFNLRWFHK